jgi:hypothetical protein
MPAAWHNGTEGVGGATSPQSQTRSNEFDARSVAIAAAGNRRLRRMEPEDFSVVLGGARRPSLASGLPPAKDHLPGCTRC